MDIETRSNAAHQVIDKAATALRELGFAGAAPWRAMAWNAFDGIIGAQCAACGTKDLLRLRGMIDSCLAQLAEGTPQ